MKKLTTKGQMLLYAFSGFGINLLNLMMGSYLCSALLVGGFGESAVPYQTFAQKDLVVAGLWAVFGLIAKIIDGVIDIPMASLTDGLKTRWGKRRPSLIIGLVPMLASYVLFLFAPNPEGATVLNTIYYGLILCTFYSFYTLTMVTYYATFTEIVEDEKGRSFISNVKSVFDIFYFIAGYVVVRALLNSHNVRTVAFWVLPIAATMLIPLFMIKEPSNVGDRSSDAKGLNLIQSLTCTFKNRDFIIWMAIYSCMTFGVQLFLGGINEYFSFVGMNMMLVMSAAFAPVPFALILYNRIFRKHNFGFAFRYVLIVFAVSMLSMFFVGILVPAGTLKNILAIASGIIGSFGIGTMFSVAYLVPAQLAAEEEKKTGLSHSAMYFAVQGLFSGVATGLGANVVLTALKGTQEQNSGAIAYMTLISAAGVLVSLAFSFLLPKGIVNLGAKDAEKRIRESQDM